MEEPIIVSAEPAAAEALDKVPCGICRRQFSKYTCPTCNIAYCSLTCFRSESHSQCSETFYRKEVESGIKSEPSKSAAEKLKLMELLKRLEQRSQEDDQNFLEFDDDDADKDVDLTQRLGGMDINSISSDDLWSVLTPEERARFVKALDNPSSELAQQLLASEALDSDILEPWWEAPSLEDATQTPSIKQYGAKPDVMPMLSTILNMPATGSPLLYNICALCIAYAYTIRYIATSPLSSLRADDPDFQEARRIVSRLAPFLTDRKTNALHSSLSDAVTDVWSRFESRTVDGKLISLLLRDAAKLLRPRVVTVLSPSALSGQEATTSTGPSRSTLSILMLSDLFKLFGPIGLREQCSDVTGYRQNHVTMKISFYMAHILSTPSAILSGVSDEVVARSKAVEHEAVSSPSHIPMGNRPYMPRDGHNLQPEFEQNSKTMPMIEELR